MKVSELNDVIEGELDARCGNGHFSRWTSFGQSLYRDFKRFERILEAEYKKIGLALS